MSSIKLIDAVPTFISQEEHTELTGVTPAAFTDIPSVLRHQENGVAVTFDPLVSELTEEELKDGTLYIIESVLAFISTASGRGFEVAYPSITLHAISRTDTASYIYCQLDDPQAAEGTAGVEDEGEDETEMHELRLIPQASSSLDTIFDALSYCASLHPDPASGSDVDDGMGLGDDDDDDAFVDADVEAIQAIVAEGEDGEVNLSEAGRATLDRLESLIQDKDVPRVNGVGSHRE